MIARRLLPAALVLGVLALPSAVRAENPILTATVGPGYSISLTDSYGSRVTHLDPGSYTIVVHDLSDQHSFHLTGPGVSESTDVAAIGDATWTVTFADGTYHFQCDAHPSIMKGDVTVGASSAPPASSPPPKKLAATAGPGYTISLRTGGKAVKKLAAGSYTITVRDRSSIHDFHLIGPGVNRKTAVSFVGTQTWKVKLVKGLYRFRCDPHATVMHGSFRVA